MSKKSDMLKDRLLLFAELIGLLFFMLFFTQPESSSSRLVYLMTGAISLIGFGNQLKTRHETVHAYDTEKSVYKNRVLIGFSLIFGIAVLLANYEMYAYLPVKEQVFVIPLILYSSALVCGNIITFADRILPDLKREQDPESRKPWKYFIICFCLLAGTYLFIFAFSEYPGTICSDSLNQIQQILDGSFSNHHPVYQTFLIRFFFNIGMAVFHDINAAIAVYTVFQILFMAAVFAFAVTTISQMGAPLAFRICSLLWFMLMPCHITFSFTIWKDSLYGAFICLFIISLLRCKKEVGKNQSLNYLILAISAVGTCILRSNGLIAFALFTIVFTVVMGKKEKQILKICVIAAVISIVLKHPVLQVLSVSQPDTVESLSIPVQQIARVAHEGGQFTDKELDFIENIVSVDRMAQEYNPTIYDYVKNLIRAEGNQDYIKDNKAGFLSTWLSVVIHHPILAIRAWVDQTSGYWNPCADYWMKWWDGVCEENGLHRIVMSENVFNLFHKYIYAFINSDGFLGLTYNIGLYIWITCFCLALCVYRRIKNWCLFLPVLTLTITLLLATPMHDEFRYAYYVFTCFPLIIFVTLMGDIDS